MDKRTAEVVSRIIGGRPHEVAPGEFQIVMPDTDGVEKLVSFTDDAPEETLHSSEPERPRE